ncbi:hypothetical protein [Mangrovicoccus algicola]|uniref:Uncharacterized protein n=1 Tax=Mangrovicoccus algicola TaxID=2771008 RepID=A0A8J6ZAB3_9RHOB|nr:hypothetical protein [Mangrovicoccus algicola]MBE3639305.1 hypothetical protein [Mangrovicoccus algicola]
MPLPLTSAYYLAPGPETGAARVVHSDKCQVMPREGAEPLGAFESCAPALQQARAAHRDVNACALCCPACYVGSPEFEAATA